ncbi:nicotinamide/nicotinic acid mononucleotide adenylyltransferase 1-like isoform X1 [Centruroides vittatus]|uniref:nicotinamide/nicotinic acid mononucleotide adenylyltransferase 1-like isoform X1 n=1 Tax=Centruroides vittatus TaxID=120091 RepID=UPI00350F6AF8
MSSPCWVVLLACGSYNPITNMHLRMFELARDFLHSTGRFKVVGGIISPVNDGYKKAGLVESKHRCAMINLALKSSDWIKLDTWESEQDSWVETVKVLAHHQEKLNSRDANDNTINFRKRQRLDLDNANVNGLTLNNCFCNDNNPIQVKLLCGADLLESFGNSNVWKESDVAEIVEKYGLVIITREGSNPRRFIYESDILSKYQRNIHIVTEWITNEISSTRIRRAIRRGESVKYLIQDDIIKYIHEHNLYKTSDNKYSVFLTPSPSNSDIIDPFPISQNLTLPIVHTNYVAAGNFAQEWATNKANVQINARWERGEIEHSEQETAV